MTKDGGPAFPHGDVRGVPAEGFGMSLRDYFAIHAPEPSKEAVSLVMRMEQMQNPHNEPYHNKVQRRSEREIVCALRYEFADAMLAERSK